MAQKQNTLTPRQNILLVDDEVMLLNLGVKILEREGYSVSTYNNPKEALREFEGNPNKYSLLLTDMSMPELSGLDLARVISKITPDLPIIIYTGYQKEIDRFDAESIGVTNIMEKPVARELYVKTIKEAIASSKLHN
jgi:two-component system cell cycle sensor histidine kinase/response regulator CckA